VLERAQGWIRPPNGEALTGFNHEYKRHGTWPLPPAPAPRNPGVHELLPVYGH
jgi:hypothetical protein